jgi:hypothetical protein
MHQNITLYSTNPYNYVPSKSKLTKNSTKKKKCFLKKKSWKPILAEAIEATKMERLQCWNPNRNQGAETSSRT